MGKDVGEFGFLAGIVGLAGSVVGVDAGGAGEERGVRGGAKARDGDLAGGRGRFHHEVGVGPRVGAKDWEKGITGGV